MEKHVRMEARAYDVGIFGATEKNIERFIKNISKNVAQAATNAYTTFKAEKNKCKR